MTIAEQIKMIDAMIREDPDATVRDFTDLLAELLAELLAIETRTVQIAVLGGKPFKTKKAHESGYRLQSAV